MESSYVVSNGQIAAVTRNAHGSRFTIIVQGRTPAGDGTSVPTTFCVAFWDGDGALTASEAYTDTYTELDGVLVPATRTVVRADSDGLSVRRLVLSGARCGRDRGTVVRARLLSATVALLALAVAGGASARTDAAPAPVEKAPVLPARVQDVNGKTVVIRNVSRIVPLNGDIAETIFTLGLTSRVVGVDTSALYPKQTVDKLPKIGYQRTLSAEGILSLRPTVVIGSTEAGPPHVLEQIRAAGVTVLVIPEIVALNAGPRKLRLLGRALGVPKRGERLAKQVEGQIATAKREAATTTARPRVAFLYVRGAPVQMIGGKNTRADTMIAAAGGRDAGSEIGIDGLPPDHGGVARERRSPTSSSFPRWGSSRSGESRACCESRESRRRPRAGTGGCSTTTTRSCSGSGRARARLCGGWSAGCTRSSDSAWSRSPHVAVMELLRAGSSGPQRSSPGCSRSWRRRSSSASASARSGSPRATRSRSCCTISASAPARPSTLRTTPSSGSSGCRECSSAHSSAGLSASPGQRCRASSGTRSPTRD